MQPSYVRPAEPDDEDDLLAMTKRLHAESGLRTRYGGPYPFCSDKARATIRDALESKTSWAGIIGERGNLQGSICIAMTEPWYSEMPFLYTIWDYVLPEHRQSTNAKLLIAFAKDIAQSFHMDIVFGMMSTERGEAKMRFYQRASGVRPFGGFFLFNHGVPV